MIPALNSLSEFQRGRPTWDLYKLWYPDKQFLRIFLQIRELTVCSIDKCWVLYQLAKHCKFLPGHAAEVGVYKGGSALLLCKALISRDIHLFDTFFGIPQNEDRPDMEGRYEANKYDVEHLLSNFLHRVHIYEGLVENNLSQIKASPFSLVHIDCDIYNATYASLLFFWPLMTKGGVIVIDDCDSLKGVERAIKEARLAPKLLRFAPDQGVLIK